MPNWSKGVLKVRGTYDDIVNFLDKCLVPINWQGKSTDSKVFKISKDKAIGSNEIIKSIIVDKGGGDDYASGDAYTLHLDGTRRGFVTQVGCNGYVSFQCSGMHDFDNHQTIIMDYEQAWSVDASELQSIAQKYNIDIKIYAFEKGMQFNQDIEIVNGAITRNEVIRFNDYDWECIYPNKGG